MGYKKLIKYGGKGMRRGAYAMDLVKQIKVRVDENTFEEICKLSQKIGTTRSWVVRDILVRRFFETSSLRNVA